MTQRFRELLDAAVSDLEPRVQDPVALVVRRGRMARLKTVLTCVLAVALLGGLTAGGLAVDGWMARSRAPLPTGSAIPQPPTPHVVGDMVVAGAMELPIPAGWQVVEADSKLPCGTLANTIMILTHPGVARCSYASIEVEVALNTTPSGLLAWIPSRGSSGPMIVSAPVSITLPGGEPAWLLASFDDPMNRPHPEPAYSYSNFAVLPWSKVELGLRVDGPAQEKIINSIRSRPTGAGRLAVPATAAVAELTVPDGSGQYEPALHGKTEDSATIAAVLRLLQNQKTVVDNARACANANQNGARLTLFASKPVRAESPFHASPKPSTGPLTNDQTITVIITLGG